MMKRLLAGAFLVFGSVSAIQAQEVSGAVGLSPVSSSSVSPLFDAGFPQVSPVRNPGELFSSETSSASDATPLTPLSTFTPASSSTDFATPAPSAALPSEPTPVPDPTPDPKFLYGGRDDYRWQLGLGAGWERFRSSIFNASAVGINTSISYYLNNWLGIEGNAMTAFAPEIFDREHVKLFNLTGGPRIALRQRRWEPWVHGLVGLAHEQPQTANHSRNAFAVQLGGGADYRINPRLSLRLQGDYLRTLFFSQTQNNFTLVGGVVIHF